MKRIIYVPILLLVVVSGLVFANREVKNEISKKPISKPLLNAEKKAVSGKWEDTPDGIMYKEWEDSPAGQKVLASEAKIMKSIKNYTNIEAVVTSLSLPAGTKLGFGVMVNINGEDFILSFWLPRPEDKDFKNLHSLKVNDKIIIKSHNLSHAPKYEYPIISGEYVERNGKVIYKRAPRKDGC